MQRIAFIFPGQGSQKKGMGRDLYKQFPQVKRIYDEADAILGYSLSSLSFEGPKEKLMKTEYTQPAVLTNSWAIASILKEMGFTPTHTAGHSLGEYTALLMAGVFDFPTALQLVKYRGRYMEEACSGGQGTMAAILGLKGEDVSALCQGASSYGVVVPANFNAPGQIVISGEKLAVEEASALAIKKGARGVIPLKVSGPFHSPLMEKAASLLKENLNAIAFSSPSLQVVGNVTANYLHDGESIRKSLVEQLVNPVLWRESIDLLIRDGVVTFVEVGPGKVLKGLMRQIDPKVKTYQVEDLKTLEETRSGLLS